jgi:hypothetical protein
MEKTIYNLTDLQTGKILSTYTYPQRNRARNRADKLNLEYGAIRYDACPVFDRSDMAAA